MISFTAEDRELKEQFARHLQVLVRFAGIELWTIDRVIPGAEPQRAFDMALDRADVALLLISADYLASDCIQNVEVPKLIQERELRGLKVIPVLLRTCLWSEHPWLCGLRPVPGSGQFVASLEGDSRDRAFMEIVAEIKQCTRRGSSTTAVSDRPTTVGRRIAGAFRKIVAALFRPPLDVRHLHVLRILTRVDGAANVAWVAERLNTPLLEARHLIQQLVDRRLVTWSTAPAVSTTCLLTPAGLEYVCAHGLTSGHLARPVRRRPPHELAVLLPPSTSGIVQDISEDGSGMGIHIDSPVLSGSEITLEVEANDRLRTFCARVVYCRPTSLGTFFVGLYIVQPEARQRLQTRIGDLVTWKNHSSVPPR